MNSVISVFFKHKNGGFNKRLYALYLGLANRGIQVHYIAAEKFPVDHKNIYAHVINVPFSEYENYLFWALFIIMAPISLLYHAGKNKIDHFVVFEPFYACLCLPAKLLFGKPLITFIRSDIAKEYEISRKPKLQQAFNVLVEMIGLKLSDKIIPNSHLLAKTLMSRNKLVQTRFVVIPNNIKKPTAVVSPERKRELRLQYGIAEDDFIITTVAVFNETKNISFLVQAFAKTNLKNAKLLLIGDAVGNDKNGRIVLEKQVQDLNLNGKTVFAGWVNDPSKLLGISDLFVIPSREEGSPNALLEALGCGLPCLGSRIPEIKEVLQNDELLFSLVPDKELSEKIEKAAIDSAYYRNLSELSFRQMNNFLFDWEEMVFKQIYTI